MSTVRPRLDLKRIIDAAIAIADESGLDAASMRAVAERLRVTPMALYKHLADRAALVDAMLDRILADVRPPAPTASWDDAVRSRIMATRAAVSSHAWTRQAIETREHATPRVLAHMDALMADMFAGGLSADLVHHAMHALSTRMWGFTRDVLPTPVPPDDPRERAAVMAAFATTYPAIIRMATTAPHAGRACDDEAEFSFALDLLLDGIRRRHEQSWTSAEAGAAPRR